MRQAITQVPQERFDAAAADLLADLIVCKNKVASALYRSIGFEVQTNSLWYEKVIDQGVGAR